ncbi:MAG: glycosyltransferase [Chloroflexi bacterium]|nr:MAG: glycosyltransferase [Chloroflexota bacterium]
MSSSIVGAETGEVRAKVLVPLPRRREAIAADGPRPMVDIVIPVHNEERGLRASVLRLHAYLTQQFPFSARITIADNASTDSTPAVAAELAEELPDVRVLRLNEKGRGRALAAAWLTSDARVVSYMDVDLSTDLSALLPLVAPVISGHSQVSIGSRLVTGARVTRGPKREVISRVYNILLRLVLRVRFKDAQCGFKALRADVARSLLPDVVNRNWFFDTELLVRAERAGLRIHELPVDWLDDPDSRVDIVATAIEDLRGVWRLATGRPADAPLWLSTQLVRFAAVGAASTLAYAVLFWALREVLPAAASNVIALAATAVANTAANRRLTFGIRGRERLLGDHAGGLLAFAAALVFTNGAIVAMGLFAPGASRVAEIAVLTAANAIATGVRFLVLRTVLFHMRAA